MDITIERQDGPDGGRYVAQVDGSGPRAELIYTRPRPGIVSADHTLVPDALGGRGVGSALVKALVSDCLESGERIVPACSFVHVQQRRHPEWAAAFA
ncbi:GNAT family N-acetyltransferase [Paracoccus contaminans]|uniref:N-acetyltransferase domain-containing protein n=1 Tax=Paracoccus contaminans TaxID=1945662 RepID=A0A1W6CVY5_9RHOB|nr:GNAT family N-acetyltransferase [Paracoccus contaminans]ARJ69032.1 hypothetical protein B0A89_04685 [Paracoccus contaminans]